ncbi:MAG TPA: hypothetical protein PLQ93_08905 [Bacteroidia bacterium]|nr:hypothetical protein [Bacteroidia bacterium]
MNRIQGQSFASQVQVKDLSTTKVEYSDHIIYLRLKEDAEFTLENTLEQHQAQDELTKDQVYAVLVDARNHVSITKESREFMANYANPRRKATAILMNRNSAMLIMANFYMKVNKPRIPTKLFNTEEEAVRWLRDMLTKA